MTTVLTISKENEELYAFENRHNDRVVKFMWQTVEAYLNGEMVLNNAIKLLTDIYKSKLTNMCSEGLISNVFARQIAILNESPTPQRTRNSRKGRPTFIRELVLNRCEFRIKKGFKIDTGDLNDPESIPFILSNELKDYGINDVSPSTILSWIEHRKKK